MWDLPQNFQESESVGTTFEVKEAYRKWGKIQGKVLVGWWYRGHGKWIRVREAAKKGRRRWKNKKAKSGENETWERGVWSQYQS